MELESFQLKKQFLNQKGYIICKALMTGMPSYIASILSPHLHARSLRSESSNFLNIPIPRNKFEAKSFKFSAPRTWNGLPPQLRASDSFSLFKANLKTHLFPQQRRTKRPWRLRLWRSINKYIIIIIICRLRYNFPSFCHWNVTFRSNDQKRSGDA